MTAGPIPSSDIGLQAALDELRTIIRRHYPEARFDVTRGLDDPAIVELVAIVDIDEPDRVLDVVIDRQMQLQIEDGLPIFVVTERPPERVGAMHTTGGAARAAAFPPS